MRGRMRSPADVEMALVAEFRTALRKFLRRTEEVSLTHGLTPQRYDLLLQIRAAGANGDEATVGELSKRLALTQPAVTEIVKRAEQSGLILRRKDAADGRVYRLRLTAEGERRLFATFAALSAERRSLVAAFARAGARLDAIWGTSAELVD